jgi:hypothetical protein
LSTSLEQAVKTCNKLAGIMACPARPIQSLWLVQHVRYLLTVIQPRPKLRYYGWGEGDVSLFCPTNSECPTNPPPAPSTTF